MLSDYIVFWMRHNERPAFALGSFEMLKYELNCMIDECARRIAEVMKPEVETALANIGLYLQNKEPDESGD